MDARRGRIRQYGVLLLVMWGALACASGVAADSRPGLMDAMQTELQRSMTGLKIDDFGPPYFMSYTLRDTRSTNINARYGGLDTADETHLRQLYVQVRVGDVGFDNFASIEGDSARMSDLYVPETAPLGDDPMALRQTLWLLTDDAYKIAMGTYLAKQGARVFAHEDQTKTPSFTKASAVTHQDPTLTVEYDRPTLEATLRDLSKFLAEQPFIIDSSIGASINHQTRYYVNSEGSRLVNEEIFYSIHITANARAEDGMLLTNDRSLYAREFKNLPSPDDLKTLCAQVTSELQQLRQAPTMEPYVGPAILAPEATGVLFHEAVGHRLEGERQHNEEEGQTFKGQVGQEILPTFISVVDDPTQATHKDTQLNGFYRFDDEGTPAAPAVLVENGVLKGFLLSRKPVSASDSSNGHGRAQGINMPIARMGNLIVSADPQKSVSDADLKAMLIAELKRQQKPFGLYIKDITGGSTNTSGYSYQAFKGSPRLVYRVDANTGEETLVRGVEVVGTPLSAISKITAASQTYGIFNGYCGAESGYVPVSTVAPAVLLTEIELQRVQGLKERDTILPSPMSAPTPGPK